VMKDGKLVEDRVAKGSVKQWFMNL
jgi:hypothetical protein